MARQNIYPFLIDLSLKQVSTAVLHAPQLLKF